MELKELEEIKNRVLCEVVCTSRLTRNERLWILWNAQYDLQTRTPEEIAQMVTQQKEPNGTA